MPRKPDTTIVGKTFNDLKIEKLTDKRRSDGVPLYECTCLLCGRKKLAARNDIIRGKTKNCGNHLKFEDITGKKYNRLTAIKVWEDGDNKRYRRWLCKCDCGKEVIVRLSDLKIGKAKSCGCINKEKTKELYIEGTAPAKLKENKLRSTNTSGVTGVYYDKNRKKWAAEIMFKKKKYYLGRYDDKKDAIAARKKAKENIHQAFLDWYKEEYPETWKRKFAKEDK